MWQDVFEKKAQILFHGVRQQLKKIGMEGKEKHLKLVHHQKEGPTQEAYKEELARFVDDYACGIDVKPEWCVWGVSADGGRGVLYWVRPQEGDQFAAYKMADLVTAIGGSATAEMTEWNHSLEGEPRYKQSDVPDFIFAEPPQE